MVSPASTGAGESRAAIIVITLLMLRREGRDISQVASQVDRANGCKGFSVVADLEVRTLTSKSAEAAQNTNNLTFLCNWQHGGPLQAL